MKLWNYKGEQNSITEALQLSIPGHALIALTGAGGKTSLMTAWARELSDSGKKTVITTTTNLHHPDHFRNDPADPYRGIPVIYPEVFRDGSSFDTDRFASELEDILDKNSIAMVVSCDPEKPGKVMSPPPEADGVIRMKADAVITEADGSRRKPFKWPKPWEPAVPEETDITVCVAGLSALGGKLQDVMYAAEELPAALHRETVDEQLIGAVLASADGGQKGVRGEFRVFLNQADNDSLMQSAFRIRQILGVCGIQSAWGALI